MKVEGAKWIKTDKTPGVKAKEAMADYKADILKVKELQKQLENSDDDTTNIVNEMYSLSESATIKTVSLMEACVNLLSELEANQRAIHERLKTIETELERKDV